MLCRIDCPIRKTCDSVSEGKQCVYRANWIEDVKINPKHW